MLENHFENHSEEMRSLARATLLGNLMTAVMKQMRSLETPWTKVDEYRQKMIIEEIRSDTWHAVSDAVDLIAADNRTRFRATVEQVTFKSGVKAVLLMPNTEESHELADVAGGTVLVVIEDPTRYLGEEGSSMPKPEPDQRALVN
jgi:hypothetical protein